MSKTKFSRRILRKGACGLDLPPPTELLAMCATCKFFLSKTITAAVVKSVRAFDSHAEGLVFESQPRQTLVVKTGSNSSPGKRSATSVSVTGP